MVLEVRIPKTIFKASNKLSPNQPINQSITISISPSPSPSLALSVTSGSIITSLISDSDTSASLLRTLVLHQAYPDNPGSSSHLKILKLITPAKALFPCNIFNRFQGLRCGPPLVYLPQSLLTIKCEDMGQMQNTTWKLFHCYKAVLLTIGSSERPKRSGQRVEFLLNMVGHSSRKEVRVPYRLCETKTGHGKPALV